MCAALETAAILDDWLSRNWPPISRKAYDRVAKATRALIAAITALNRQYYARGSEGSWLENEKDAYAGVLRILAGAERGARLVKRGQPPKESKEAAVSAAIKYLFMHSPELRSKGHLSNAHREFVELFYETLTYDYLTGATVNARGTLDWQIRKAVKTMRGSKARR
jgi:hypothetical protein